MFDLFQPSHIKLFVAWFLPFVLYAFLLIIRPNVFHDDNNTLRPADAIQTVGQVFVPTGTLIFCYWFGAKKRKPVSSLTRERFWILIAVLVGFHVLTGTYFITQVFCYQSVPTPGAYPESIEGHLNDFVSISTYLSVIPLIGIQFVFGEPQKQ